MAVERIPGHDAYINRWTEAEHAAALAGPDHAYLLASGPDGQPAGFAILSTGLRECLSTVDELRPDEQAAMEKLFLTLA